MIIRFSDPEFIHYTLHPGTASGILDIHKTNEQLPSADPPGWILGRTANDFSDRPGPGRGNGNSTQAEIAKSWLHPNDGSPLSFRPSLGVFVKMIL